MILKWCRWRVRYPEMALHIRFCDALESHQYRQTEQTKWKNHSTPTSVHSEALHRSILPYHY